jgi:glycosyltransferase involved in cell wall biosynthesis
MPASPPSISVIVVSKNPGPRLQIALESLWAQTFPAEIIVVDGASTDGTREWLDLHHARIASLVSESDHGIYDAMNKGIAVARGEWVLFLGADDRLAAPSVLVEVAERLVGTQASIAAGEARFDNGRAYPFAGTDTAIRRNFVHHQATFYRRAAFERYGGFDTALRIQADYEFNLRLVDAGEAFASLNLCIAECGSGGVSDSGLWANYREEITVRHRHFSAYSCWPWDVFALMRYLRKKIVRRFHIRMP